MGVRLGGWQSVVLVRAAACVFMAVGAVSDSSRCVLALVCRCFVGN